MFGPFRTREYSPPAPLPTASLSSLSPSGSYALESPTMMPASNHITSPGHARSSLPVTKGKSIALSVRFDSPSHLSPATRSPRPRATSSPEPGPAPSPSYFRSDSGRFGGHLEAARQMAIGRTITTLQLRSFRMASKSSFFKDTARGQARVGEHVAWSQWARSRQLTKRRGPD